MHFIKTENVFFIKKLLNINNDAKYTGTLFYNNIANEKINNININNSCDKYSELCSIEKRLSNININIYGFKYHYKILNLYKLKEIFMDFVL